MGRRHSRGWLGWVAGLAVVLLAVGGGARARAMDLMFGPGFGRLRRPPRSAFGSVELDQMFDGSPFGIWAAADVTKDGTYLGLGPMAQVHLGPSWILGASSGPGYCSDRVGLDLGDRLEFRSTAYLFYRMPKHGRVGLTLSHYSNAGLSHHNPGAEAIRLLYCIPL